MSYRREVDWGDAATWWFAGYVSGLLFAAAFIMLAGCWHGEMPVADPIEVERVVHPSNLDCHKLVNLVGRVPAEPLFIECALPDPVDYWYCRADQYRRWAEAEHVWIGNAIAECTP